MQSRAFPLGMHVGITHRAHSAPSKAHFYCFVQVARSLGITEFLRRKETPTTSSQEAEGRLEEGCGRKRERELGMLVSGVDWL